MKQTPTVKILRQNLRYDPVTGHLWWTRPFHMRDLTRPAGTLDNNGYIILKFRGKCLKAHRIIWAVMTGRWPKGFLDHKNGVPGDNRWANLRKATAQQNVINRRRAKNNSSGLKGAHRTSRGKKWGSSIKVRGRSFYLGTFIDPKDAHAAYVAAARKHFGEFARTA